jgi:hypothetical protein
MSSGPEPTVRPPSFRSFQGRALGARRRLRFAMRRLEQVSLFPAWLALGTLFACSSTSGSNTTPMDASAEHMHPVEAGTDAADAEAGAPTACVMSPVPSPFPMGACNAPEPKTPDSFDQALGFVGLTRCSLNITSSWASNCFMNANDSRRMPDFSALLSYPLRLPSYGKETAAWIDSAMSGPMPVSHAIALAAERRGTPVTQCASASYYSTSPSDATPLASVLQDVADLYGDKTFDLAKTQAAVKPVPRELQVALVPVLWALAYGSYDVRKALAGAQTPLQDLPYWIRAEGTFDVTKLGALDAVDTGLIATAATQIATAVESGKLARFAGTSLSSPVEIPTAMGAVVIHGSGDDVYMPGSMADGAALLLDLGGNDTYKVAAGGSTLATQASVAIDLAGKDDYGYVVVHAAGDGVGHRLPSDRMGRSSYGYTLSTVGRQGAGTFGIGLLFDLGTDDDTYQSLADSQGSGILGVGVLYDEGGNDSYDAEALSQGAAGWGIGVLLDGGGTDHYVTYYEGQGFGFTKGVGVLADASGNDVYYADPGDPSLGGDPLYPSAQLPGPPSTTLTGNTSLTQGAGYGLRPDNPSGVQFAGGLGILRDLAGDDTYTCSVFGQATAFAMGTGMLLEGGGDDTYEGLWYVQGSAAHTGLTFFDDVAGNDKYNPTFPIQATSIGVGHDCSASVHYDEGGDDAYKGPGLSMGSGNDNGVGVMVVTGGTDAFSAAAINTLGAAMCTDLLSTDPSRVNVPTVGVFVKANGSGDYTVGGVEANAYPNGRWSYTPETTPDGGPDGSPTVSAEKSVGIDRPDGGASLP